MHVVQALVSLNLGGSELVATELTEYLAATGHRVTVIAANGPLAPRVSAAGAAHLDWPIGRKRLATLAYVRRLAEWLNAEQPDVLHVHSRLPAWICLLALRRLSPERRPAFVTSMHGHYSVNRYSAVMARGDRVIAVSDHIREYTLRNYPMARAADVITVHGGTSAAQFPYGHRPDAVWWAQTLGEFPELEGKRIICLPGRLSRYKGHADFIELVAALAGEFPDIHGVVVGKARPGSRYRSELEGLAGRLGVLDRVTFTGARLDMRDWLAASEIVYSLCSDPPEAFGRTVPEALHLGVRVIGWDHGGVQEVLAGMFPEGAVPPDDPAALLDRTRAFLRDPPPVPPSDAFGLDESMRRTCAVYRALRPDPNDEAPR
ncbi:glycosyltransferase [Elongatibacter sediminis]|uniref:Glycosyltransferase n=1 Tax=Elongatibacter sediminis TaxID=3119006 RepID=A0AAW9RIR6_9GAMM